MNRYKKLLNNSLLFAIGNFGSKLINLIMVPLYTFVLSPIEYGQVDLMLTTISLILPIITVSIGESVIRYTINVSKEQNDSSVILSNAVFVNVLSTLLLLMSYPLLKRISSFENYFIYFFFQLIISQYQVTISQYVRGIGKVKVFAMNGILMTLVTATLNIILLVNFSKGISGYIISIIMSNFISIVYMSLRIKVLSKISLRNVDFQILKNMLIYSVPLIPNMIMWWLITGSSRYFILYFIGNQANGLFAVASKIPALLTMFTTIFQQAWQISAFEEYESKDRHVFFKNVFNHFYQLLFLLTAFIIPFLKVILTFAISNDFYESWKIMPFLLLSAIYQSLSSFIGTNYTASMKTKGVLTSSVLGAIVAIVANLIFIPTLGVVGASIGTFLSFFSTYIYRVYDTKNIINIDIDWVHFLMNNLIIFLQIVILFIVNINFYFVICQSVLLLSIVIINKETLSVFFNFKK